MECWGDQEVALLVGIDERFFSFRPFHDIVFQINRSSIYDFGTTTQVGDVGLDGVEVIAPQFGLILISYRNAIEVVDGLTDSSFALSLAVRLGERHLDNQYGHFLGMVFPFRGITIGGYDVAVLACLHTFVGVSHASQRLGCVVAKECWGARFSEERCCRVVVLEAPSGIAHGITRHVDG